MSDLFGNDTLPPGVYPKHGMPYVWVTWLTALLSGEEHCKVQAWMKIRYRFDSARTGGGDMATWKQEHDELVQAHADNRGSETRVTIEDQNKFTLKGETALLGGKPDLIIYDDHVNSVTVVDVKGGEEKAAHWWQVWLYLLALPKVARIEPPRLKGEVRYRTKTVTVTMAEVQDRDKQKQVGALMRVLTSNERPAAVPSPSGCAFCDVPKSLCPDRDDSAAGMTGTTELF